MHYEWVFSPISPDLGSLVLFFAVNIFHYLLRGVRAFFFNRSIPRIERCFFGVLIKIDFTIAFSRLL